MSGAVDGIAFVLDVPVGLTRVDKSTTVAWRAKPEVDPELSVSRTSRTPTTLDQALSLVPREPGSHMLRQEPVEGGFLIAVAAPSRSFVHVHVFKTSAGATLECQVSQANLVGEIPKLDAEVAWMSKACSSIAVE